MFKTSIAKMLITMKVYILASCLRNMHFGNEYNKLVRIINIRISIKGTSSPFPVLRKYNIK